MTWSLASLWQHRLGLSQGYQHITDHFKSTQMASLFWKRALLASVLLRVQSYIWYRWSFLSPNITTDFRKSLITFHIWQVMTKSKHLRCKRAHMEPTQWDSGVRKTSKNQKKSFCLVHCLSNEMELTGCNVHI